MIKKHLVTCSVMLVLVIVSKLFICSTTDVKPAAHFSHFYGFRVIEKSENEALNFADEALPLNNKKVDRRLARSVRKHGFDDYKTAAMQRKIQNLFAIIQPILKLYGIPEDFKYVPLLESGLNGRVSKRGAVGIWQFMPQTARDYGLAVSGRRDERLSIRKSTVAACKYIKDLYSHFNSWTLTAAAYNGGSPHVQRAINRKNKGNYFYMRLNRETGTYVYKLIALKRALGEPGRALALNGAYTWLKPSELLAVN